MHLLRPVSISAMPAVCLYKASSFYCNIKIDLRGGLATAKNGMSGVVFWTPETKFKENNGVLNPVLKMAQTLPYLSIDSKVSFPPPYYHWL